MSDDDRCSLCPFAGCPECDQPTPQMPGQTTIDDHLEGDT